MAGTEQEVVNESKGGADDWLSEAMDQTQAAASVESESQTVGEVETPETPTEAAEATAGQTGDRPRDEQGRFKPKSTEAAPAATKTEAKAEPVEAPEVEAEAETKEHASKEDRDGWIPSWRAREISEAKRAAAERAERAEAQAKEAAARWEAAQRENAEIKRRLDELTKTKAPETVNLFENPEAFVTSVQEQQKQIAALVAEQVQAVRLENNLQLAHYKYGDEFTAAYDAVMKTKASGDLRTIEAIKSAVNPGEALVQWHRQQRALTEFGTDPDAYRQKVRDELMKDPEFRAQIVAALKAEATGQQPTSAAPAQSRPNNIVKRPPSLSHVPGGQSAHAGGRSASGDDWLSEAMGS